MKTSCSKDAAERTGLEVARMLPPTKQRRLQGEAQAMLQQALDGHGSRKLFTVFTFHQELCSVTTQPTALLPVHAGTK